MQTIMDITKTILIKKFHVLLGKAGIGEMGKREMLASYGVTSTRDLSAHELLELCDKIDRMMKPDVEELDKWRKRLIASIFGWRKAMGDSTNINEVKAIACRAAGVTKGFNSISLEKLRSLYYAFTKKTKDMEFVDKLTADEIDFKTWVN